ncbi:MAG: competence protein CoiA family protein [Methylobacter sp.]
MNADDKQKNKLELQAEEVGCWGLIGGIALNVKTHKEFSASSAKKRDGPFYCKACLSDAVIRKCTEKRDHFAHKAKLSPIVPKGKGKLHGNCQDTLCELLAERFPGGKWETERTIPKNDALSVPELRPDISGRINNTRVAIEVQVSSLTVNKIVARTEAYAKRDISLLWIVPLTEELGNKPIRPRQYERYLHSIYYGRVYYWWDGLGLTLMPVHFGVAKRYIEIAEWYENNELVQVGGYEKPYKTIKTPLYGPELSITDDFVPQSRPEFIPDNERKAVPLCSIWMDKHSAWWMKDEYGNE